MDVKVAVAEPLVGLYTLWYRESTNHLHSKNFRCPGSLKEARARAEKHCNIMGYKFHFVQPMISDFAREESFKLEGKFEPQEA